MTTTEDTWAGPAGALFRSLGHEYRLEIMELLRTGPLSGDLLAARTGVPKPLLEFTGQLLSFTAPFGFLANFSSGV